MGGDGVRSTSSGMVSISSSAAAMAGAYWPRNIAPYLRWMLGAKGWLTSASSRAASPRGKSGEGKADAKKDAGSSLCRKRNRKPVSPRFPSSPRKFGCVIATCGIAPSTLEGLSQDSSHLLQQLWVEMNVPQCGYCQSGMLMAAAALLKNIPNPTDRDIDTNVDNICRCGTYPRVRAAIHKAAARSKA
jgi:hypothetical protein